MDYVPGFEQILCGLLLFLGTVFSLTLFGLKARSSRHGFFTTDDILVSWYAYKVLLCCFRLKSFESVHQFLLFVIFYGKQKLINSFSRTIGFI